MGLIVQYPHYVAQYSQLLRPAMSIIKYRLTEYIRCNSHTGLVLLFYTNDVESTYAGL